MEMKLPAVLLLAGLLGPVPAQADIWLCVGANNRQSIQDKPCTKDMRIKSHVQDTRRRTLSVGSRNETAAARAPIEVGLQRNKTVICNLLNTEKIEALAQIGGSAPPPPGENPQHNLSKIEKQRLRVGCDAG